MQLPLSYLAKSPYLAKSLNPVGLLAKSWLEGDGQNRWVGKGCFRMETNENPLFVL